MENVKIVFTSFNSRDLLALLVEWFFSSCYIKLDSISFNFLWYVNFSLVVSQKIEIYRIQFDAARGKKYSTNRVNRSLLLKEVKIVFTFSIFV
jgi:hypothetical protein